MKTSETSKEYTGKDQTNSRKNYIPENLNNKLLVRKEPQPESRVIPEGAFQKQKMKDTIENKDNEIYKTFFTKFEKMKESSLKSDKKICKNSAGFSSDSNEIMLVPKEIHAPDVLELKIEHEIIKDLEDPDYDNEENSIVDFEQKMPEKIPSEEFYYEKAEYPVKEQENYSPNQTSSLQPNSPIVSYLNLNNLPLFFIPKNLLYLKASSLFNDTILFENDDMSLFCKTDRSLLQKTGYIILVLTMRPKNPKIELISFLENEEKIKIEPQNLTVKNFDRDFEQSVFFSMDDKEKLQGFPILNILVGSRENPQNIRVMLPFTINKYLFNQQINLEEILKYLENVK